MFLPSPFSGWLVDRFGYLMIAVAAGVTLLAAGLLAAWAPVDSVATLLLALVLSGSAGTSGLSAAPRWSLMPCRWLPAHAPRVLSISASRLPALELD
jgi:MFS family permease